MKRACAAARAWCRCVGVCRRARLKRDAALGAGLAQVGGGANCRRGPRVSSSLDPDESGLDARQEGSRSVAAVANGGGPARATGMARGEEGWAAARRLDAWTVAARWRAGARALTRRGSDWPASEIMAHREPRGSDEDGAEERERWLDSETSCAAAEQEIAARPRLQSQALWGTAQVAADDLERALARPDERKLRGTVGLRRCECARGWTGAAGSTSPLAPNRRRFPLIEHRLTSQVLDVRVVNARGRRGGRTSSLACTGLADPPGLAWQACVSQAAPLSPPGGTLARSRTTPARRRGLLSALGFDRLVVVGGGEAPRPPPLPLPR